MKLVVQPIKNYLLFIILFILPINIWAASGNFGSLGDKNGFLKPVSKVQLEKQIKDSLIKQVKVYDSRPYQRGFSQQVISQQYAESALPVASVLMPSMTRQNEAPVVAAKPAGASSTNLQEREVDESDFVKTDGRFLYAIDNHGDNYYYYGNTKRKPSGIRIFDTKPDALHPRQIGVIGFAKGISLTGIFLTPRNHQILAIGNSYSKQHSLRRKSNNRYYGQNVTHIIQIDIKNKNKPKVIRHIKIEGSPKATRRIKNQLYLVLSANGLALPQTYKYVQTKKPISKKQRAKYKQELINKIKQWKIGSLFPRYQVLTKTGIKPLGKSGQFLIDPNVTKNYGMTTLLAIDLSAKNFQFDTLNYFGRPDTVYVSQKALYITKVQYRGLKGLDLNRFPKNYPVQEIHKFAFKGKGFDYRGSGAVLGRLNGWSVLSSFNLDEDKRGNLRVVTNNASWIKKHTSDPATSSPVVLTALAEHPNNKQLITLSRLPNRKYPKSLGKPGEMLYGARLFNDYAYFVTFQRTDPLYVVDMRNPYDMKVTGELIIPGFSSYLHPISKSLLLGVGKDAKAQKGKSWALFQGLKLSLFDISNPNLPREVDKIQLGKRGTSSPVNRNHHALTSLRMPGGTITRIAMPISVVNKEDDYQNQEQGLHQFEVDIRARKIKPVGKLVPPRKKKQYWSWNSNDRSIIIDNTLYYYSDGRFWAGKW